MKNQFFGGLNGLRGIACVVVLIFHSLLVFSYYGQHTTDRLTGFQNDALHWAVTIFNGPACVTLFFVLSGVVLSLSLDSDAPMTKEVALGYWIKRLSRLYPLLILASVLAWALQVLLYRHAQIGAGTTWLNADYRVSLSLKNLARNALGAASTLNSPAWSIKVEILESALFPLLFILARKGPAVALATAAVLLTILVLPHGSGSTVDDLRDFTLCFFIGALIPRWSKPLAGAVSPVSVAATVLVFCGAQWVQGPAGALLEIASASFIIIAAYHRPARFLDRPLRRLGELSYSIYLLHMPVLLTIVYLWHPVRVNWAAGTVLVAALTLAATLPLAYLSYSFFERPLERAGRRTAKGLKPAQILAQPA
jgi:peptidoglycan/LPS O-acetylase OafA/YrhL